MSNFEFFDFVVETREHEELSTGLNRSPAFRGSWNPPIVLIHVQNVFEDPLGMSTPGPI